MNGDNDKFLRHPHEGDTEKPPENGNKKPDRGPSVKYQVNGEKQSSDKSTLSVEEILSRAGDSAGIDVKDIGSYYLECLRDGKKFQSLSNVVEIENNDRFLAVYSGRTPVA